MTPATLIVLLVLAAVAGIAISYVVIRNAVCAGILDAERKRELAAAERQQVTGTTTVQRKPAGSWMDRIAG